jgi:hypothetical protein
VLNNGNIGIGVPSPSFPLDISGGSTYASTAGASTVPTTGSLVRINALANVLGTTIGNYTPIFNLSSSVNGNNSYLNFYNYRFAAGSTWTNASTRIQQTIDGTNQAYIEFNPPNASSGIGLYANSSGNLNASALGVTIYSTGNVSINTTTSTSTLNVGGNVSATTMSLTGTTASTSAGSGTMILSGSGAGLGVAGNVYVGGNLYSTASSTLSGINYIDRIAELIANPSAGATSFDYSTGSVFYYSLTSSANITANFLNVNPSAVTNRTFVASLIISSGTYKGYVSAVTVSATGTTGASNTLYFNGGASAISVSSASVIVQTFAFVYTSSGSAPAFTLSNVASYQA